MEDYNLDWLSMASTFQLGMSNMYNRAVEIQSYEQMDGSLKWAVKMNEWVLGKDLSWHWQPNPSGRDTSFLRECRYDTKEEAYDYYIRHINEGKIHTLYMGGRSEPNIIKV